MAEARQAPGKGIATLEKFPKTEKLLPGRVVTCYEEELAPVALPAPSAVDRRELVRLDLVLDLLGEVLEPGHPLDGADELVDFPRDLEDEDLVGF